MSEYIKFAYMKIDTGTQQYLYKFPAKYLDRKSLLEEVFGYYFLDCQVSVYGSLSNMNTPQLYNLTNLKSYSYINESEYMLIMFVFDEEILFDYFVKNLGLLEYFKIKKNYKKLHMAAWKKFEKLKNEAAIRSIIE